MNLQKKIYKKILEDIIKKEVSKIYKPLRDIKYISGIESVQLRDLDYLTYRVHFYFYEWDNNFQQLISKEYDNFKLYNITKEYYENFC